MRQVAPCIDSLSVDERIAQLCSFPDFDTDRSLIDWVRSARASVTLGRLTSMYEGQISSWNCEIFRALRDGCGLIDWGSACWNPIGGVVQEAISKGNLPPEFAIVGLAFMVAQAGVAGQWRLRPTKSFCVAFGRHWFRCEKSVELCSDGRALEIKIDGVSHRFQRISQSWRAFDDSTASAVFSPSPLVLSSPTSDVQRILSDWPQSSVTAGLPDDIRAVQDAWQHLQTHASNYAAWVQHGASAIVLASPRGSMLVGGSSDSRPGLIVISRAEPIELLEALVHEATHQYLITLAIVGDLHDGSDTQQYFSPLRQEMRPFRGILSAHHVLCNLTILYEALANSGSPDQWGCAARLDNVRDALRATDSIVYQNSSLTELGTMLSRFLHERVKHALA
jgi:hypothetical protein